MGIEKLDPQEALDVSTDCTCAVLFLYSTCASTVEACSKRQRLDSSALNFPAFSDASLKNPTVVDEGHLTEVGSLVSHLVERSEAQNHNPFNNINVNTNATHETMMNGGGSVGHPPMVTTHPQTQISTDTGEAQRSTPVENNTPQNAHNPNQNQNNPHQDDGPCRSGILGGVYFNSLVKSMMHTTSTET